MHVIVTGGAGFIGSHIVDALIERGDTVTVVDNLSSGRIARLPADVDLRQVDITDPDAITSVVADTRPEVIVHLAAQIDVRTSVTDPAHDAAVNIGGTINLLEAARGVGAKLVYASTGGALYGQHAPLPTPEHTLPEPEAPYGTAKHCAEQYLGLFNRLYGTQHAALRMGNIYGPRQDPGGEAGVIGIFCGRIVATEPPTIFGDGKATRDYVYVADAVEAFLAAADSERGGVWNIGTGRETSVLELVEHVCRSAGYDIAPVFAPARAGELQHSALDVAAAERDLGWKATMPIKDGIPRVYEWVANGQPDRARR
ncbi:NAD-dependent epimerase/dehydratase family protein [Streptosporangium lutulentum]|uniref:UDP-glucose 4-epimerase n=1 Tax=Streptosporangium lutulentum TaxID=1461250 RepID=A0ABT9Q915_9ACTN|nr:NAD-dependent epimerase/dehydratase family protein [Streptosporangium lutulentum]MDP9843233.1 UDP-glucose 4-epimerase [Streptosporangium lutulentum]